VHCALAGQGRADRKSNGIVHITDWFTTLLTMAGLPVPDDRVIGRQGPVGFRNRKAGEIEPRRLYWNGEKLYGVKWQNFKLVLMEQKYLTDPLCRWDFRPSSTWSRIPKSASLIQPDTGKPVAGRGIDHPNRPYRQLTALLSSGGLAASQATLSIRRSQICTMLASMSTRAKTPRSPAVPGSVCAD
jgi:hypothetical protein